MHGVDGVEGPNYERRCAGYENHSEQNLADRAPDGFVISTESNETRQKLKDREPERDKWMDGPATRQQEGELHDHCWSMGEDDDVSLFKLKNRKGTNHFRHATFETLAVVTEM
jgi:hypothetical protein